MEDVPSSSMWRRLQRARRRRTPCNEVMGIQQLPAAGTNKRRPHGDEDQQQAQGAKKMKKATRLLATGDTRLPSFLTEYTAEDIARFDEDMAHTDRLLDETAAKLSGGSAVVSPDDLLPPSPDLLELLEAEEESGSNDNEEGGQQSPPGRVSDATVKMIRAFTTTRFHPISERFLRDPCFYDEDVAEEIRESDRFFSKVYAWTLQRAKEAVEEYDAKGYLDRNADGTIKLDLRAERP